MLIADCAGYMFFIVAKIQINNNNSIPPMNINHLFHARADYTA